MLVAVSVLALSIVTPSLGGQPVIWKQYDGIIAKGRFFNVYPLFHFVGHIFRKSISDIFSYFFT